MAHVGPFTSAHGRSLAHTGHRRRLHATFASRTPGHGDTDRDDDGCGDTGLGDTDDGVRGAGIDWCDLLPRQIVGVGGGFVAVLAIAASLFPGSVADPGSLTLLATVGVMVAAAGFGREIGRAARQAVRQSARSAADGRHAPR